MSSRRAISSRCSTTISGRLSCMRDLGFGAFAKPATGGPYSGLVRRTSTRSRPRQT